MATSCSHGFAPEACLICRTLGGKDSDVAVSTSASNLGRARESRRVPESTPARPDVVFVPQESDRGRPGGHGGTLLLILMALLAIGAAAWILAGVVFTILHVLELVAVAAGTGWVGYKIGHFRGSRHPHRRE
jgi:hypothetical protein